MSDTIFDTGRLGTSRLDSPASLAAGLNSSQLEAYNWNRGPLLVLAGPGSGKTRVLTHRMVRLIEESAGRHFQILGLTFTNKAAAEMQRRVSDLVPNADRRIRIDTYHSFGAAILRQHGHCLGISPDFAIMTQNSERTAVLEKAIVKAGMSHVDGYDTSQLLEIITRIMDAGVDTDMAAESLRWASPDTACRIGKIYGHYRQLMIKHGELDYGGLLSESLNLLTKTTIGGLIRRIYPFVCVDEFQDTNDAQYKMLCSIVDPSTKNLFVVADDNQTIYEWNGASPQRVCQIQERFGMDILQLPENYRCPADVVKMANKLIARNLRHDKAESVPIKTQQQQQQVVRIKEFDTVQKEADWIAVDIAARSLKVRQNCAVFARTQSTLKHVVDALDRRNIRAHLLNSRVSTFVNDRMMWLHSTLRLANSRQDDRQLVRICKLFYTLEGIDMVTDDIKSEAIMTCNGDLLRAWHQASLRSETRSTTRLFLQDEMPKLIDRLDVEGFVQGCFRWFALRQDEEPAPDYNGEYTDEKNA